MPRHTGTSVPCCAARWSYTATSCLRRVVFFVVFLVVLLVLMPSCFSFSRVSYFLFTDAVNLGAGNPGSFLSLSSSFRRRRCGSFFCFPDFSSWLLATGGRISSYAVGHRSKTLPA